MVRQEHLLAVKKANDHQEDDTLLNALEVMCRMCSLDVGRVWYVDDDRKILLMGECWGNETDFGKEFLFHGLPLSLPYGEGIVGKAWEDQDWLWIADVSNESTYSHALPSGENGALAFPVMDQKKVVAVLEFVGDVLNAPTPEFLNHTKLLSRQLATLVVDQVFARRTIPEPSRESSFCIEKGLAHDLNNILTVISGLTEMGMLNVSSSSPVLSYFSQVQEAISRGKNLIRQVLEAPSNSPISCGPPSLKAFSLGPVVHEVLEHLRGSLTSGIQIHHHLPAFGISISGNADELYRVLLNLCTNAIQAMNEGGRLDVTLEELFPEDEKIPTSTNSQCYSWIHLSVRDTGVGMAREIVDQIFEPRFTTKSDSGGIGLGLAITRRIVLAHGGLLSVKSKPGLGTCFSVFLPRER